MKSEDNKKDKEIKQLRKRIKELEISESERKRAEEENTLLAQTLKSVKDCISITDLQNTIIFVNEAFLSIYGYTEDEILGKKIEIVRSPIKSANLTNKIISATLEGGWHGELINRRKDGSDFPVEVWTSVVKDNSGIPIALVGVARDITERKQNEDKVRELLSQLEALVSAVQQGILFEDEDRSIKFVNHTFCDLFGIGSPESILGANCKEAAQLSKKLFKDSEDFIRTLEKRIVEKRTVLAEELNLKDGRNYERDYIPVIIGKKKGGNFWIYRDITERKKTQEALRESEERYRGLSEAAFEAIFISEKGICLEQNSTAEKMFGYTLSEAVGRYGTEWIVPEHREIVMNNILSGYEEPYEVIALRKDGTTFPCEIQARMMQYMGREVRVTALHDITERKRAEAALLSEKQLSEEYINSLPGLFYVFDEKQFVKWNKEWERITGYSSDELATKYGTDFFEGEDRALIGEQMLKVFREGASVAEAELVTKDGQRIPYYFTGLRKKLNGKDHLVGLGIDITERMKDEKALKISEERLALTLESAELGLWDKNVITGEIFRNKRWAEMLGYTLDEIEPNLKSWKDLVHPDDLSVVEEIINDHEVGKTKGYKVEHRMRTKNGEWKWILNWGRIAERDENGRAVRALGTHLDITERKRAEDENTLLAQTLKSVRDCISITDLHNTIIFVNDAFLLTYGYTEDELLGRKITLVRLPVESTDKILEILPATLKGGWHGELINQKKDGTDFPIELWTSVVEDSSGSPIALVGVARDITERKQAEEKLRKSEEQYRDVIEKAGLAIVIDDEEGAIKYYNDKFIELFGYTRAELKNHSLETLAHPGDNEKVLGYHRNRMQGKTVPNRYELRGVRKNGDIIFLEIDVIPYYVNNKIVGTRSYIWDITKRKRAEEEIKKNSQEQNVLKSLLQISLEDIPLEQILERCMDIIFSVPFMKLIPRGSIFLVEGKNDILKLKASRNQPESLKEMCAEVPFGHCLCGKAAQIKQIQFADCVDEYHHNQYEGIEPHGHYNAPILSSKGETLGVLCLYLPEAYRPDQKEETFILAITNTLAGITERKQTEEELRKYSENQAVLVREINHRVRNNLSALISMLYTEEALAEKKGLLECLPILQNLAVRIDGLSTVHSLLSESEWQPLRLSQLCENVINAILRNLYSSRSINLTISQSEVLVDSNQAHYLAMVINELSTNSLKHAFRKRDKAVININIEKEGKNILLRFHDDGPGYPQEMIEGDFSKTSTGFELIRGIVKQSLIGDLELRNDNGAVTIINFKNMLDSNNNKDVK